MIVYHSIEDLKKICAEQGMELWQAVLMADAQEKNCAQDVIFEQMRGMYRVMREADADYDKDRVSASGMAGGDGEKMRVYNAERKNICGDFLGLAMEKALKMGESNACMRRIVAAPTAGSCGIIPAVFLAYQECFRTQEDEMVKALLVAAGVGKVIAQNASISGAAGGCQAEIGSASAMAAAGVTYLQGGNVETIFHAMAMALKNMLGLTCDPVCGLVEVPCIKRNSAGAVNAITTSQLALAGIKSVIPPDEVIDSMRRIGNDLPACLKETGQGGLAITDTARKIAEQMG